MTRTGRRPGQQDTRKAILAAARRAFAERGYDGASIRWIAAGAEVDPALVYHYFNTKHQLFLDAMQAPYDPSTVVPAVLAGGRDGIGDRVIRTLLSMWDSSAGSAAIAFIRSAVSNEQVGAMMRELVTRHVLGQIIDGLDIEPAEGALRATLVGSQIAGLVMVRYVVKIEPLASADQDTVVALIGPTIQRYLTAPLPAGVSLPATTPTPVASPYRHS